MESRKTTTLRFRARDGLRAKVEAAAAATGRSLSEECEHRLAASFAAEAPSLTGDDVRAIIREELAKAAPNGGHSHSLNMSDRTVTGDSRYVGMGLWVGPDNKPVFPFDD